MQLQVCPHCYAQFFNNGAPPPPPPKKKKALWSASGKPQEAHHSQNNSRELLFPWPSPDKIVVNSPSRIFCGLTILYGMDIVWSCSGCNLATFLPASLFRPLNQKSLFSSGGTCSAFHNPQGNHATFSQGPGTCRHPICQSSGESRAGINRSLLPQII